jgi:dCTP deaminase
VILPAQTLRKLRPVRPFVDSKVVHNGMSYGCSSAGYDIRVDQDFVMWPGRFVLGSSIELFTMPSDVLGMVCDKSTWVRRGISVHNTVIEPGWRGHLTVEIKNGGWRFRRIRAGDPIAQILFLRLEEATDTPYAGKYQDQDSRPVPAIAEVAA